MKYIKTFEQFIHESNDVNEYYGRSKPWSRPGKRDEWDKPDSKSEIKKSKASSKIAHEFGIEKLNTLKHTDYSKEDCKFFVDEFTKAAKENYMTPKDYFIEYSSSNQFHDEPKYKLAGLDLKKRQELKAERWEYLVKNSK